MWGTFDPNDPEMTWKIGHDFFIWKLHKTSVIRSKQNKGRTINIPKIHYFRAFSLISESAYDKLKPFSRIYYHKVSHHSNKTPFWTSVVVCQIWLIYFVTISLDHESWLCLVEVTSHSFLLGKYLTKYTKLFVINTLFVFIMLYHCRLHLLL